jgi:hypothetical protein
MVREIDGTHSVYLEQRHFDPESFITTTNQGLCFSTDEWHIFTLQVAGVDQALKLGLEQDVMNQHMLQKNITSMLSGSYGETSSGTQPPPLQAIGLQASENDPKKKRSRPIDKQ